MFKKVIASVAAILVMTIFLSISASADTASELGISEEKAATLDLWLEADEGVVQDDNGYVTEWTDKTGNYTFYSPDVTSGISVAESFHGTPTVRFTNKYLTHTFDESEYYTGKYTLVFFGGLNKIVTGFDNANFTVSENYWGIGSNNSRFGTYARLDNGVSTAGLGGLSVTAGAPLSMYAFKNGYDANYPETYKWNLHQFATNGGAFTQNFMAAGSVRGENNYRGLHTIKQYRMGDQRGAGLDISAALVFRCELSNADVASIYKYLISKYSVPTVKGAKVDETGQKVILNIKGTLDKTPSVGGFTVYGADGYVSIDSVTTQGNEIILTLENALEWKEEAYISYEGDGISAFYDMVIDTTTAKEPAKFVGAEVSSDGGKLLIKIENEILKPLNVQDFTVVSDGTQISVTKVYAEDGYIKLEVLPFIPYGAKDVSFTYSGKAMYSDEDGYVVYEFTKPVDAEGIDRYSISEIMAVKSEGTINISGKALRSDKDALDNVTVMVVVYDGFEMTGFKAFTVNTLTTEAVEFSEDVKIKGTESDMSVKMYVCNNIDDCSPLMAEIPVTLE